MTLHKPRFKFLNLKRPEIVILFDWCAETPTRLDVKKQKEERSTGQQRMRSEAINTQGGAPGDRPPAAPDAATTNVPGNVAVVAASCVPSSSTGAESPATPMEVALATHAGSSSRTGTVEQEQKPANRQQDEPMTASQVTQMQNEQRRERHWRRTVHSELRDRLVAAMYVHLGRRGYGIAAI